MELFNFIKFYFIIATGICFSLPILLFLRLLLATHTVKNKLVYIFFVFATLSLGMVSFYPIVRYFYPQNSDYLLWVALFMAFSLNLYFLSLIKACKNLTVAMLVIGVMLMIPLLNNTYVFLPKPAPYAILVFPLYMYSAYCLIKQCQHKMNRVFLLMTAMFILMALFFLYDAVSYLCTFLPIINLCVWLAPYLALSMGYGLLDSVFLRIRRDLQKEIKELTEEYAAQAENVEDVVIFLARTVDAKDKYTEGHIERVSQYAIFLGERIGMDSNQLNTLRIAALIHDIGKISVDLNILNKPDRLTDYEFQQMKNHCIMGEQICTPLKVMSDVSRIIRSHHEKLDGSGYPDGLHGESIPLEARIVTIADMFDALTTDRPYRPALEVAEAIRIIDDEARQGKLDLFLVKEFLTMLVEMEYLF